MYNKAILHIGMRGDWFIISFDMVAPMPAQQIPYMVCSSKWKNKTFWVPKYPNSTTLGIGNADGTLTRAVVGLRWLFSARPPTQLDVVM